MDHGDVMQQPIEDRRGQDLIARKDLWPIADMFV